uniref:Putative secreted protein n=1 Tax=Amblyomma cajennense TaxID=34607 RepID=A0A023FD59_AMBCJ
MLLLLLTFHCFRVTDGFHKVVEELKEVLILLTHSTQLGTKLKLHLEHVWYHTLLKTDIATLRCSQIFVALYYVTLGSQNVIRTL